jgi:single-strand DNA-binding protein
MIFFWRESISTNDSWKNPNGGYESRTEWHRCTVWGKLTEFASKLEKGAHVQIEGELRYREYKQDRGSDADTVPTKRRLAEIHVNRILKLDRTAKQDEPAPEEESSDFPVEEATT